MLKLGIDVMILKIFSPQFIVVEKFGLKVGVFLLGTTINYAKKFIIPLFF
jgi:hypothetical protein